MLGSEELQAPASYQVRWGEENTLYLPSVERTDLHSKDFSLKALPSIIEPSIRIRSATKSEVAFCWIATLQNPAIAEF